MYQNNMYIWQRYVPGLVYLYMTMGVSLEYFSGYYEATQVHR